MANSLLTSLGGLSTPASADSLYIVSASDTTDDATGTNKKITYANLVGGVLSELGVTASVVELNYTDGVTSAIQTQMDTKAPTASPTFTGTVSLPADSVNAITEIASGIKSGADGTLVTGTAGTASDLSIWNADGDLVDGPTPPSGTIIGTTDTQTLTNKRITKRITTIVSNATPTVNTDNCDAVTITALATAITSMTSNLSGTPTNFQTLIFRILDDGTGRAITWGATFQAMGVALPTTTTANKVLTVGFLYDTVDSKWGCVASADEA